MTVASEKNLKVYEGNGATTEFGYDFRILSEEDLVVRKIVPATGEITTLELNADYTVTGAGLTAGGVVAVTGAAPEIGTNLVIRRAFSHFLQGLSLRNQGDFFIELVEDSFDLLTMYAQQLKTDAGLSLKLLEDGSVFDATDKRVVRLGPATEAGDAVPLGQISGALSNATAAATAAAEGARDESVQARNESVEARNDGLTYRNETLVFRNQTEVFRNQSEQAKIDAQEAAESVNLPAIYAQVDEKIVEHDTDPAAHPELSAFITSEADRSEVAADRSETARDTAFVNADVYADIETGRAAVADGEQFQVVDGDEIVRYRRDSGSTQTEMARYPAASFVFGLIGPGENLHDPSGIVGGWGITPDGRIATSSVRRISGAVPVVPGQTYTISGVGANTMNVAAFPGSNLEVSYQGIHLGTIPSGPVTRSATFTIPADHPFLRFEVTHSGISDTNFDLTSSVALGTERTAFPYRIQIPQSLLVERLKNWIEAEALLTSYSYNMLDPTDCNFVQRYSVGNLNFITDTIGIAASGRISVEAGQTYAVSGALFSNPDGLQGGAFSSETATTAIANLTFTAVVGGHIFTVPAGATHIVLNLWKTGRVPSGTTLESNTQMERGNVVTPWRAFAQRQVIRAPFFPDGLDPAAIEQAQADATQALSLAATAGGASIVPQPELAAALPMADVRHVLQVGQSLAIGAASGAPIHTGGWDQNYLTFSGGPKAKPVAAGGDASLTASFKTLVEDTNSPDNGSGRGETGLWSAAQALAQRVVADAGAYSGAGKWLFTAPGFGGQSITFFRQSDDPTSWWQTHFLPSMQAAKAICDAASETYAVAVVHWVQGEASSGSAWNETNYAASLTALFDEMAAAVTGITGQSVPPQFVCYVTAYGTRDGDAVTFNRGSTLGQIATIAARNDTHLGASVYALPNSDAVHLTSAGYAQMGRVLGEALADMAVDAVQPRDVAFKRAYLAGDGDVVEVLFDVTGGSLVLDGVSIPLAQDHGFRLVDGSGTVPITSVEAKGNAVRLAIGRALSGAATVRYAVDYQGPGTFHAPSIATGNLRLSPRFDVHGVAADAFLWVPPFIRSVQVPTP